MKTANENIFSNRLKSNRLNRERFFKPHVLLNVNENIFSNRLKSDRLNRERFFNKHEGSLPVKAV